jgi:hypothetical protein
LGILKDKPSVIEIMNFKNLTFALVGIAIAFVVVGDRFLPNPASAYSLNARTFFVGLVPHLKPQKPNAQTEQAVDSLKP